MFKSLIPSDIQQITILNNFSTNRANNRAHTALQTDWIRMFGSSQHQSSTGNKASNLQISAASFLGFFLSPQRTVRSTYVTFCCTLCYENANHCDLRITA